MNVVDDLERIRMVGSAYRKTGRRVVLVPLGRAIHAGHLALLQAARRIRGAVVVAAVPTEKTPEKLAETAAANMAEEDTAALEKAGVDVVWRYTPAAARTKVVAPDHGMEDVTEDLTRIISLVCALGPSDLIMGEKDYELLVAVQQACTDLHIGTRVQGVPPVRMPDGLVMSLRNAEVAPEAREQASALSAALTAGAYAAEAGAEQVISVATEVLRAAGVEAEYVELRGRDLGEPPAEGEARLFVAATLGGVRLTDNVGVPLGIGFRNLEGYGEEHGEQE
ncbi:pantoate--beta-alanine ligase [Corynebacterium sp.]|uniref:pantoate--beta-alanine ligase n=1 Tax=Corynebacterium sp. TaxID=1720 RepID=UPI0026DA9667|nr:pantoate--beta-alanine ligase [Corynebacterium sp.]MDO5032257.1 pantoate--beta-alanine ligase [Corynebacterium sp.]